MPSHSLFLTNGMFIIDKIDAYDKTYNDVIGGGGTWAILGGCIVTSSLGVSRRLRWIVDRGSDFPVAATKQIESWQSGACFRDDLSRLTTRGYNLYGANELREFKYITKKKRIDVEDWKAVLGTHDLQKVPVFHLVCSDERALHVMQSLPPCTGARTFVWEPVPDLCDQQHFEPIRRVMNGPDHVVISPNAQESARLFGLPEPVTLQECQDLTWKFDTFMNDTNACVVRCGKLGCLVLTSRDNGVRSLVHLPAYHFTTPELVVDPTGGGNTFLGAFALGYVLTHGDLIIASICGNIAAGCAIEQIGVPGFNSDKWNGLTFVQRLTNYLKTYPTSFKVGQVLGKLNQGAQEA
ncbi:LAMI_0E06568g1_1 [Lachancea mirantina]|uniref:LAMI_0E06568g1_1 n=1 Tax=Lachancea mirantina TaxID=1230905 RepID=A0A1G4JM52_9SACH|nr:LAMI_0E06568g1_1 [Lachancea mirantina]